MLQDEATYDGCDDDNLGLSPVVHSVLSMLKILLRCYNFLDALIF